MLGYKASRRGGYPGNSGICFLQESVVRLYSHQQKGEAKKEI